MLKKIILFTATVLFSTGCTQQYFVSDAPVVTQTASATHYQQPSYAPPTSYNPQPNLKATTPTPTIDVECSDEVAPGESDCDRGEITADQLTGQNTQRTSSGVIHSLKSIQGHWIKVIERPTGFVFPNYRGKTIIFVMFGKDCPHCIEEIPVLKSLKQRYRGQVEVIAVQTQERMAPYVARSYINQHRINYPIIEGDDATDLQYFIQNTYGWTGILPFTMVVKDGITEMTYSGAVTPNEMRADMDTLF